MPFARTTKDELMVLSARRCCVCHRYKGVGVEVHHIVPEAKGGSNETENGIVLCFDCHAAAGHYNPAHPRGTKFSPSELRQHREKWFDYVSKNLGSMRGPEHSDTVVGRYLMTADRICAKKIIERDPTSLVQSTYVFVDTKLKTAFYDLHRKYSHATPDHETDGFLGNYRLDVPQFT